ncbi:MAG: hypothetical protein JWO06_600 [Bacteroidota bacterium]|nr:hypothetical protein [Bacteroidota bacterium]
MKRFFLLAILTVSGFLISNAQTELPQVRAKKLVSKVNNAVALQGQEWSKVNDALVTYYTNYDALEKQKEALTVAVFQTKVAELKVTRDNAVKGILTADQASKYTAFIANEKE